MTRFSAAKDLVLLHLGDIVPELFGAGAKQTRRRQDGSWQVANRWRATADMSEMKIWHGGAWKDFVNGEKGDAIDLVTYGLTGTITDDSRMKAIEWIEDRYGVRTMPAADRAALLQKAEARRQALDEEAIAATAAAREKARKAFYAAAPAIVTTDVERYARTRGVDLISVPHLAASFRFRADCDYWPSREFGPKAEQFPAMLSAMVDVAGRLGAVHYTFLEPGGGGKLDTLSRGWVDEKPVDGRKKGKSAKLMYPATAGLVVRVTRGPSGLTCEQAEAQGVSGWWGITEGIEDGWSIALSDPELRMHAAGSLSGYLHLTDHPAAKGFLLFRDNDWDKPQAVELFDRAYVRLKAFGKPVEAVAMPAELGKDANDVLNWKG